MNKVAFGSEKHPLQIASIQLPCFILEDGQYVFTKSGIQKAYGYDGKSTRWLLEILNNINKFSPLSAGLLNSYEIPIPVEISVTEKQSYTSEGITPEIFLDTCAALVRAKKEGYLSIGQLKISKSAETILNHVNHSNIRELIDVSTGFNFYKESRKEYLQRFLTENLKDDAFLWVRALPDIFFLELLQMHQLDWGDLKQNPSVIGKIIHEIIFSRIPNDLLEELRVKKPKRTYQRKNNNPQEILLPKLKQHISSLLSLLKASGNNWNIFLQLLNRTHPKNPTFFTRFPIFATNPKTIEELSVFNSSLIRMSKS